MKEMKVFAGQKICEAVFPGIDPEKLTGLGQFGISQTGGIGYSHAKISLPDNDCNYSFATRNICQE